MYRDTLKIEYKLSLNRGGVRNSDPDSDRTRLFEDNTYNCVGMFNLR